VNDGETTPALASTLILVRARGRLPEILLLKRGANARFMPNAHVFAGGAVDAADASGDAYGRSPQFNDREASARLNLDRDGLRFFIAAIRESFEECGLLLAYDGTGAIVDLTPWSEARLHAVRSQLSVRQTDLASLCRAHGWTLATDQLAFYSHWITPRGSRRRFDTRFFIARAPLRQRPSLADGEMSHFVWRTAAEALSEHADGKLLLMLPTHTVISEIAGYDDVDALLNAAARRTGIAPYSPDLPG
jgi:8-oxo-dGTP pyrophosphatase MutT (NUDIX family)